MRSWNEAIQGPGAALRVSADGTRLERRDGKAFFWLGDTAWLINARLTKELMIEYLDDRAAKGFSVIQVMAVHSAAMMNAYGDRAIPESFSATSESGKLDSGIAPRGEGYWETLDFLFGAAADRGIYVGLVPVWGAVVQSGLVQVDAASRYAALLAGRYRRRHNLIWINGGDLRGCDHREVWEAIGSALKDSDPDHPITFHPFGRTRSSTWFHQARWLDFNMFQSGHRDYGQRMLMTEAGNAPGMRDGDSAPDAQAGGESDVWYGEDNWRYALDDIALEPRKPTLDGEPSYEDIPHGLHDFSQPRWTDADCRRYAYWSLLAGAFGHTYGHNSVMQFHEEGAPSASFGARKNWRAALDDPGARSMTHVRALVEALGGGPFVYAPERLAITGGERYERRIAARAGVATVVYAYSGGTIALAEDISSSGSADNSGPDNSYPDSGCPGRPGPVADAGSVADAGASVHGEASPRTADDPAPKKTVACWYDPRSGGTRRALATSISGSRGASGTSSASAALEFTAPGPWEPGNDWILVVEPENVHPSFCERLESAAGPRIP